MVRTYPCSRGEAGSNGRVNKHKVALTMRSDGSHRDGGRQDSHHQDGRRQDGKRASFSIARSYEKYYRSGVYDDRYPRPNPRVLKVLIRALKRYGARAKVIDFGCGTGRYLLPLLRITDSEASAYDISHEPLVRLREALKQRDQTHRVTVILGDEDKLKAHHGGAAKADVAMMIFGVLSHIASRGERLRVLRMLGALVDPVNGRVVLSVPNRRRRFRALQKNGCADVVYQRSRVGGDCSFSYHLYAPDSLERDLNEAGLVIERMYVESVLPESLITRYPAIGLVDSLLAHVLPTAWGYGILVVARPGDRA